MHVRLVGAWCALACLSTGTAGQVQSNPALLPAKPWVLDYGETECFAERMYSSPQGPVMLGIRAMPNGETYDILFARLKRGPKYAVQRQGTIDLGAGPIKTWILFYGVKDRDLSIEKVRVSASDLERARSANSMAYRFRSGPETRFTLRAMPKLLDGLKGCLSALRQYWNIPPDRASLIARPVSAEFWKLFRHTDYPDQAMSLSHEGTVEFRLLVDEKGAIANCNVEKTSGIPVLEVMGCQVLRERAKLKPAQDSKGNAMRSSVVTPPISWRIDG